jgi:hypothetical protein
MSMTYLLENEIKGYRPIHLAETNSRQHNTQSAAWILLAALIKFTIRIRSKVEHSRKNLANLKFC